MSYKHPATPTGWALLTAASAEDARNILSTPFSPNMPYASDYWCDITNGVFESAGSTVSQSVLLTHNTPPDAGYVEVCPAFTNKVAPFLPTLGAIGSGGAWPTGWDDHPTLGNDVVKTIVTGHACQLEFSMTLPADTTSGIRTPAYSGLDEGDIEVSFYLDITGTNADRLRMWVAYNHDLGGKTYIPTEYAEPGNCLGHGRITVTLPPCTDPSDRIDFMVENGWNRPVAAHIVIRDIVIAPAVSTYLRDALPVVAAAFATDYGSYELGVQAERTATLNVPDGDYAVFGWTDRGIRSANATASGGDGIDLAAAFGCAKFYKIAAWESSNYVTGTVDDDPAYVPVYQADTAALQQMHTRTAGYSQMVSTGPEKPWSLQRSTTFWGRNRVEVRPGDTVYLDPTRSKRRAEIVATDALPYNTDIWMSYPIRIHGGLHDVAATSPNLNDLGFGNIWQWRYQDMIGDLEGLSPEFALTIHPGNEIRVSTQYSLVQNPPHDGSQRVYVNRWSGHYVPGQWHRFVARIRFSNNTGTTGKLGIWWDGVEVYPWQDTQLGHAKQGLQPHWGYYVSQSDDVIAIERANVEFGTADLSDRILNPLPI